MYRKLLSSGGTDSKIFTVENLNADTVKPLLIKWTPLPNVCLIKGVHFIGLCRNYTLFVHYQNIN